MTPPLSSGQRDSSCSCLPSVFLQRPHVKVRCNYEMPCARCIRVGLECRCHRLSSVGVHPRPSPGAKLVESC